MDLNDNLLCMNSCVPFAPGLLRKAFSLRGSTGVTSSPSVVMTLS